MTFDLTPEQQDLVSRVRTAAADIGDFSAATFKSLLTASAVNLALAIEEASVVDAGLGARVGFESLAGGASSVTPLELPGLVGSEAALAAVGESNRDRARLVAAAVALGIGRAAVDHAVAAMKRDGVKPGPETTVPHWSLADGATDVAAARLLTYEAAQSLDRNDRDASTLVARAKAFAATAAAVAVDAAIRIEGGGGYVRGGLLERLTRDARTVAVIL